MLKDNGCEVKHRNRKHISLKMLGQKSFIRLRSLSGDYSEDAIRERLSGKREASVKGIPLQTQPRKFNLLIDIQNSIKAKTSPGYEQWAKIFNLKQVAKTLVFLQENDLDETEKLNVAAQKSKDDYNYIVTKIKTADSRLGEISKLQKHIGAYIKTKDIYAEFKQRKFSKKFYAENKNSIEICKAAKRFFDEKNLKKLPAINSLKQEYATILTEKKRLYSLQTNARNYMQKMLTAQQNTKMMLRYRDGEKSAKPERNLR